MDWEDCVVDVHSVKLSKTVLETMFKKCGPVRSITHWRGQGGEKPHVFFEYKSPASADSARLVGLDRNDLQVIKISNNEMLKRKFRELAHGPLHDRDLRCRPSGLSPRSTSAHFIRETNSSSVSGKNYKLPAEHTKLSSYDNGRDPSARYEAPHRNKGDTRDLYYRTSTSASVASSTSNSRETHHPRRDRTFSKEYVAPSKSIPLTPPMGISASDKARPTTHQKKSSAVLQIPHAGEIIKFDLDTQLEENPTGIISILSAVKANQKLWMMTAAYYRGKNNLESAKKVLEAGIDMAVQVGEENDTKPFWHLLGQINGLIQERSPPVTSVFTLTPMTPSLSFTQQSSPDANERAYIPADIHQLAKPTSQMIDASCPPAITYGSSHASPIQSSKRDAAHNPPVAVPQERHAIPCLVGNGLSSQTWPTGPRKREIYSNAITASTTLPCGPLDSHSRLYCLQNEIGALREKQNSVLEDLSVARAGKRRAEEEVKEERSVRRKLEKHLKAMEDTLARSKRMEDAALDQVKREVEARRRAEGILADLKAKKEQVEQPGVSGPGKSLFNPTSNDTTVLFHLASMIRGVSSNDHSIALPLASGRTFVSPARIGGEIATIGQSDS